MYRDNKKHHAGRRCFCLHGAPAPWRLSVFRCLCAIQLQLSAGSRELLSSFYTEAVTGVIIKWLQNRDRPDRELAVSCLDAILFSSVPAAVQACADLEKRRPELVMQA